MTPVTANTPDVFYPANKQVLNLTGLQDQISGAFVNNAVVVATLLDSESNPVAGLNALALAYVASSNGNYQGIIPASFNPPVGGGYTLQITVTVSGVLVDTLNRPAVAKLRTI